MMWIANDRGLDHAEIAKLLGQTRQNVSEGIKAHLARAELFQKK